VVLAPLAWDIIRTGKLRAAVYRQLLWLYCLVGIAVLPMVWLYGPKLTLAILPARAGAPVAESAPIAEADYEPVPIEPAMIEVDLPEQPELTIPAAANSQIRSFPVKTAIAMLWLGGLTLMLVRLAVGWYRLGRICRLASPVTLDRRLRTLRQRKLGILVSSRVAGPVCFGLIRPTIILPRRTYESSSAKQLQMVLNHELAHIERKDCWANFLQRIVEAVFFFHPLVWWASFQLTQEREQICDNYVVAQGASATDYTALLAQIVEQGFIRRQLGTVALLEGGLLQRVRKLLDPRGSRRTKLSIYVGLLCTTVALTCFAAFGSVRLTAKSGRDSLSSSTEAQAGASMTYGVTVPERWKPYLSAGKLTVLGAPFYGARCGGYFAASPHVRVQWPLKNLTAEPIFVCIQYKSKMATGRPWKTGFSIVYGLGPKEERLIDDIIPMISAKVPVVFYIVMHGIIHELPRSGRGHGLPGSYYDECVTTEPLPVLPIPADGRVAKSEKNAHFQIKEIRLNYSQKQGNLLEVEIANRTDHELPLVIYAGVGDPNFTDRGAMTDEQRPSEGTFAQTTGKVKANSGSIVRLPYSVPSGQPNPLLVFTLLEPTEEWLGADDPTSRSSIARGYISPFYWGWFNLRQAADQGVAKLPPYVPVEERAKLTVEKRSEHFLFRYRPDSYAERHIETAIKEREQAYEALSSLLKMDLPETVTIDLYPDMEAKGLGSGTLWTPANTVNDKQIAELYNEAYQCDPYHELAHLFSCRFSRNGSVSNHIVEPFAAYFESYYRKGGRDIQREILRRRLDEGELSSLKDILVAEGPPSEKIVAIDFLLKYDKDVEKFKKLYGSTGSAADLEKASLEVYGQTLEELEHDWSQFLRKSENVQATEQKRREQNE
jgi:beta-lactamase regulating signal transducer with metallopeptidase domain